MFFLIFSHSTSNASSESNRALKSITKDFIENNKIEGMSIAIIQDDEIKIYNYGFSDKKQNKKTTNDTIYRINSFSKTITATLASIAHLENKINLDSPFTEYLDELKTNEKLNEITTTHLLAHVGGMPFILSIDDPKNYDDVIKTLKTYHPVELTGKKYMYSNYSIGLVGYILESVYKQNYEKILYEKIGANIGLQSTYLKIPEDKIDLFAIGHDENNNTVPMRTIVPPLFAAGELKSTISDMAKYLHAQINYEALKNSNLKTAISLTHKINFCFKHSTTCQELGWQDHELNDLQSGTIENTTLEQYEIERNPADNSERNIFIDKTGAGLGFSSYMAYIPQQKKGVVVLINKTIGNERVAFGRTILNL